MRRRSATSTPLRTPCDQLDLDFEKPPLSRSFGPVARGNRRAPTVLSGGSRSRRSVWRLPPTERGKDGAKDATSHDL